MVLHGEKMCPDVQDRGKPDQRGLPKAWIYVSAALAVLLIIVGVWALWQVYWGSRSNDRASVDRFATPAAEVEAAPDFSLQTADGRTIQLSDYRGQVVLLNTWATWCPPCRDEMPDLEAYYRKRQADGFVVLAVNSQESAETVASFLEEHDFTFPVLLDPDGVVMRRYGIRGLPTSYFIDRDGVVRGVWSGQLPPARLREIVDPLL
jgi:cytochrome c biogenesis protein CcmG/thiol:disulfide interchange protein DsbE